MRTSLYQALRLLTLAALLSMAPSVDAQPRVEADSISRQIFRAFDNEDYEQALELIDVHLEQSPNDYVMLYNAACAHCRLGDHDAAVTRLYAAMKAGFRDFELMRRDPDLAALRDHPTYAAILEAADRSKRMSASDLLERWRNSFGDEDYIYELDEEHHIAFAASLDETSFAEMRANLERQADQMLEMFFDNPPSYYVLVAIALPQHANRLLKEVNVGGRYDHGRRELVARDIGGTLRHEFFHVYHYGHMERLNQLHPIWIQEGLASLYEDYELRDGAITFLPNERNNIVKRRAEAGRLVPWDDLLTMTHDEFMSPSRVRHLYPQVRSMFRFVAEQGKLREWYKTYVEHFDDDRTGVTALEKTFGMPVKEIEREWNAWVRRLPYVDNVIRLGDAALGIQGQINSGTDGVRIEAVTRGSAAQQAGLQVGDVIVSIDGRETRSFAELRRLIGAREVGDEVEVRLRRDGRYLSKVVILQPLGR